MNGSIVSGRRSSARAAIPAIILILLFSAVMLAGQGSSADDIIEHDGFQYRVLSESDGVCQVELASGWASGDLVIPASFEEDGRTCVVTSIGEGALRSSPITSVVIPDTVTAIHGMAFHSCESLVSVTIPEGVASIGRYAFFFCMSLSSLEIPGSVETIGANAFASCYSISSVTFGDGVAEIGPSAFASCTALRSVDIPDSVTGIGDWAFEDCTSLGEVRIGAGASLGSGVFSGCTSIEVFEVDASNPNIDYRDGVLFEDGGSTVSEYIGTGSASYEIPDGVTKVAEGAFSGSTLESIVIPDSVTEIGDNAFSYCTSLESVNIPDSVVSMGEMVFYGCSALREAVLPAGMTAIPEYTFYDCGSLESVNIPDGVTEIGDHAFMRCLALDGLAIPDGLETIGTCAFMVCSSLGSIGLPDGVTYIGSYAFASCSSLKGFTVPAGVTELPDAVFTNCRSMESVEIHDSVTSIGNSAFKDCASLVSIRIPDSVSYIGLEAFSQCGGLETVSIGDGECSVVTWAFGYCTSLKEVRIGPGTDLDPAVFIGCRSIEVFDVDPSNPHIMYRDRMILMDGGSTLLQCLLQEGVSEFVIPDGIARVESSAFYHLESLEEVTLGADVSAVGEFAFYATSLDTVFCRSEHVAWEGELSFGWYTDRRTVDVYAASGDVFDVVAGDGVSLVYHTPGNSAPSFSVPGGRYTEDVVLELTCDAPAAVIRYTLDGSLPTGDSPVYAGPIVIDQDTVVRAIAVVDGVWTTDVVSEEYDLPMEIPPFILDDDDQTVVPPYHPPYIEDDDEGIPEDDTTTILACAAAAAIAVLLALLMLTARRS